MPKIGVLLTNIGTPDAPEPKAVFRYLIEFLSDPYVIDLPIALRLALVYGLIVPFRYKQSTKAYKLIWTEAGSPLLVNSQKTKKALQSFLGEQYQVEFAMRYGNPSIKDALERLKKTDHLYVLPLFPQYAAAAAGSSVSMLFKQLSSFWNKPTLHLVRDFYQHPAFIAAYASHIEREIENKTFDVLIMSYHGLPQRHVKKSGCHPACDDLGACPPISEENSACYRAQCFATSLAIANKLGLPAEKYRVSFQSRLGRTPWIQPYTDFLLPALIKQGKSNIAIVCPSFTADCLETLEEVAIRAKNQWTMLGGKQFHFIPCLNDSDSWIKAICAILHINK